MCVELGDVSSDPRMGCYVQIRNNHHGSIVQVTIDTNTLRIFVKSHCKHFEEPRTETVVLFERQTLELANKVGATEATGERMY